MGDERIYPLSEVQFDGRFSHGLLYDAVALLEKHGYPRPTTGRDLVALQLALYGFLYTLPSDTTAI